MNYNSQKKPYHPQKKRPNKYTNFDHFNTSKIINKNKRIYDAYKNVASGFGGSYDPISRLTYNIAPILDRATIESLYRQDWLSRKVIETVPDDITRKWIDLHMPDEKLVQEVQEKIKSLKAVVKIKEATINARLYGGSVIILGTSNYKPNGSFSPFIEPLDYENLNDIMYLNVLDKNSLQIQSYYKDPFKEKYGEPEIYKLNTLLRPDDYNDSDSYIHETRLLRFDGAYLPEFIKKTNLGWSDSILNSMGQALKQYGTSIQSGALLFQDFISKTLKMPNLTELLQSEEGRSALELRMQYAIANFSSIGIILLGENEEFNKIQTPISGLPELIDKYIEIGSASSSIPRARLFGQSLGTLAGATETTRAYYDYLGGYQIDHVEPQIYTLIKIILSCKSFSTNGKVPEEWGFKFNSLWDATDKEVTTARKMQAQVDDMAIEKKILTSKEVRKNRYRPDGYSFDTVIDPENPDGEFSEEQKLNMPPKELEINPPNDDNKLKKELPKK